MIISSEYLNKRIVDNTIEKLNLLSNEKGHQGLSNALNIDLETAQNINKFYSKNFVSENDQIEIEVLKTQLNSVAADKKDLVAKVIEKIEIGNVHSYMISVDVYNPGIVRKLDTAIVNYLRNNEYIKKRIEARKIDLLANKLKLIRESRKLDSLKGILYKNFQSMADNSRQGSNNVILSDRYLTDPMSVFKEDLSLDAQIRGIDYELYTKRDFEVVDGLTTFNVEESDNLLVVLIKTFIVSFIGAYIILGLWKFNQYLGTIG